MARRLPPLNALRAFEAAARHASFTKAATELNVTQAAISHQVKALEERLGVQLFRRLNRTLELTGPGARYLPEVTQAFDALAAATERLTLNKRLRPLRITVLPSLAAKWLMPRLRLLREAHPEIDLAIDTGDDLLDFATDEVDAAIRYGYGSWPGTVAERILTESLFPVCSPALTEGTPPLRVPSDLCRHVLLHERNIETWSQWCKVAGVTGIDADRGPAFSHSNMVLAAAIDGLGVALGRSALVADDLEAGRLVRPFGPSMRRAGSYWFVCRPSEVNDPRLSALRDWLKAAAAATPSESLPEA